MKIGANISNKLANMGFVCAVMVVLIHMLWAEGSNRLCWWSHALTSNGICRIANSFFFACAGYLLAGHIGESGWWLATVKKRCQTLVIPYFAWSLLFFGYLAFKVWIGWSDNIPSMDRLGGFYLFDQPQYGLLWFVRALFFLVVLSPGVAFCLRKSAWTCVVLLFVINLFGYWAKTGTIGYFFGEFLGFSWMFYFATGMALRMGLVHIPRWKCFRLVVCAGAGLTFLAYLAMLFVGDDLSQYFCIRVFVLFMLLVVWSLIPARRWPGWLTSCAFPLYLTHLINVDVFRRFFMLSLVLRVGSSMVVSCSC